MSDQINRVGIELVVLKLQEALDNLKTFKGGISSIGDAGKQGADGLNQITAAEQQLATGATDVKSALAAIDGVIDAFKTAPIEAQKGALEGVRDELKRAEAEYASLGESAKDDTEAIRAKLADVEAELAKFGDAAKAAGDKAEKSFSDLRKEAQQIADPVQRLGKLTEIAFNEASGKVRVTTRDINTLTAHVEAYKEEVTRASARGPVSPATLAQLQKYEDELEHVTQRVRKLRDAEEDQRKLTAESGYQFTTLGTLIQDASGKYGTLIAQLGLYAAATAGVIAAIKKVADEVGVEYSTYESWVKQIKDTGVATNTLAVDLQAGLITALSNVGDETKDVSDGFRDMERAIERWHARQANGMIGVRNYNAALAAGLPVMERAQAATNKSVAVGEFFERTLKLGREGQRLWNEAVAKGGDTAAGLATAIAALSNDLETAEKRALASGKAIASWGDLVYEANRKVTDAEQSRIDATKKAYDESKLQEEVTNGTTESLSRYTDEIKKFLPNAELHSQALLKRANEMQRALDIQDGLTAKERAAHQALIDYTKALVTSSAEHEKNNAYLEAMNRLMEDHNRILGVSEKQLASATDEVKRATEAYGADSEITKQAIEKKDALTKSIEIQKDRVEAMKKALSDTSATEQTDKLHGSLEKVAGVKMGAAVSEISKIRDAVNEATTAVTTLGSASAITTQQLADMGRAALGSSSASDKPTYIAGGTPNPNAFPESDRPAPVLGGGFGRK